MDMSGMVWCPPWYVTWSVLGMLLFPLFVAPIFRQRGVWSTIVPLLLVLIPLFHATTLAYLGIRSVLMAMPRAGTDSPLALSAGLGEAYGILLLGAIFSTLVLFTALVTAALYHRRASTTFVPAIATGRLASVVATTLGMLLIAGVMAISFITLNASPGVRSQLFSVVTGGAIASGILTVVSLLLALSVARKSSLQPAPGVGGFHWVPLLTASTIVWGTGTASWLIQKWFLRIAMTGA
jgi:hypothetical protein